MNDAAPIQFAHGLPPLPSIAAVLICAALMVTLYQLLFPRPARWPLVALALVLGGALTVSLTLLLTPTGDRLGEIHDLWSALRVVVLTVGLPEEAVKGVAVLIALFAMRLANRAPTPAEAFQASLCAAIGFAVVENALYAKAFAEASLLIAFGRGIIASFIHSTMMMIQGTFLARFVASGWRRWDLVILGWLLAAAAHAGFDWGMLRPLVVYLQKGDQGAMMAALLPSLPVLIIGVPAPFIIGLWLFRRALRTAGDADPRSLEPDYPARLALWRKIGKTAMIVGAVVLAGSIVGLIVLSVTMAQHVAPGATAALQPQTSDVIAGTIATGGMVVGFMAMVLGWLFRQKR